MYILHAGKKIVNIIKVIFFHFVDHKKLNEKKFHFQTKYCFMLNTLFFYQSSDMCRILCRVHHGI